MEKKHDTIDNVHENLRTFMSHRLWDMYKEYDISPITTQQQEPDEILLIMIFCKIVVGIRQGKGGGTEGGVCRAEGGNATTLTKFFSRLFQNLKSSDNNQAQASE